MTIEKPTVSAHLYDVLSGEFKPPTDPNERFHTLARLAIATVTKGNLHYLRPKDLLIAHPRRDSAQAAYAYRPSWAPIDSFVYTGESQGVDIAGITLRGLSSESALAVHQSPYGNVPTVYVHGSNKGTGSMNQTLPMKLGEELTTARQIVTQEAQWFFDNL